jgi:hypothetical protein
VARDQNLSGDSSPIRPSATTVGADYLLDERNAAYLRYKRAEDPVRDVVLLGLESRFGEYGSAYTQYQIGGAINGERNQAIIGLGNRGGSLPSCWRAPPTSRRAPSAGKRGGSGHTSLSTSLEYLPNRPFRASLKFETRDYGTGRQNIWSVAADGKVSRDWSLLGKYQSFGNANSLTGAGGFPSVPLLPCV